MRVLVVKTSSLGDVIHTFPALTDATRVISDIQFDWVVEEAYVDIPSWHPAVDEVITTAMRRWRQSWVKTWLTGDWKQFSRHIKRRHYDIVIDAQGLIKSALITRQAQGVKHGLDKSSAREGAASRFYNQTHSIDRDLHAIDRIRFLFAQSLGYEIDQSVFDYGLQLAKAEKPKQPYVVLLHGTTWASKQWPLFFWQSLIEQAVQSGYQVMVPFGNEAEKLFAEQLIADNPSCQFVPPGGLTAMASVLQSAAGVVSVDTGLGHMAAAFEVPVLGLYGATSHQKTGIRGRYGQVFQSAQACSPCLQRQCKYVDQQQAVAPCTREWSAEVIWQALTEIMDRK